MRTSRLPHQGFGLIEILVTLGVLSIGILGVTTLHATVTRQSLENKARTEALAIAQSRMEDLRNYTGDIASVAQFELALPNTSGFGNSVTITGTNAVFTRAEQIGASGELKSLVVRVTWTALDDTLQSVSLHTSLAYVAPRSAGDIALETASTVESPTGKARLGEGELPGGAVAATNGDGTSLYRDGGKNFMLAVDGQIVLVLPEACQTESGTCIEFARIKGRVWIDRVSQNNLDPGDVYVIASNAAFCARYYTSNGITRRVTDATTNTTTTSAGSYEYFDYTCYVGGGWYGNVGILLKNGWGDSGKLCMGDPVSTDARATPVVASRRVYRGMLYKYAEGTASGKEEFVDHDGRVAIRYYSRGIASGIELPKQDFVVGAFQQDSSGEANCLTQGIMTRTDATVSGAQGALFAGMPTAFVCLNDGYLDTYDNDIYGSESTCPYDPSNLPTATQQ